MAQQSLALRSRSTSSKKKTSSKKTAATKKPSKKTTKTCKSPKPPKKGEHRVCSHNRKNPTRKKGSGKKAVKAGKKSLNTVLRQLGYKTEDRANSRKAVIRNGHTMRVGRAGEIWDWLEQRGEVIR